MENKLSMLKVHIAVVLFSLAGLFGKWIELPPSFIAWGRCIFAFVALFLLILLTKNSFSLKRKSHYTFLVLSGILLAIHWWAFFLSIQMSSVATGLLAFATFPVLTVFLEPIFFDEKIEQRYIVAAMVTFCGAVCIAPEFDLNNSTTAGAIIGLLSGLSFSLLQLLNRKFVQIYPSRLITFYQTGFASISLIPVISYTHSNITTNNIVLLIVLGVLCTAIAHSLFISRLRYVKVRLASIIAGLEPVYGIVFAMLFLNEIPSLREICGGIVILTAATMVSMKK